MPDTPTTSVALRDPALSTPAERYKYAEALAPAKMLPGELRNSTADVYLRIEYGYAMGLPPITAISSVHVIDGKPSASAGLISGVIRGAGHQLRVWTEDDPKYPGEVRAVATVVRRDDPGHTYRVMWDIDRAIAAELLRIADGKVVGFSSRSGRAGSWDKFRPSMLKARAITEIGRDACEDVLMGVRYTPEELIPRDADVDEAGEVVGTVVTEQAAYGPQTTNAAPEPPTQPPASAGPPSPTAEQVADRLYAAWCDLDVHELEVLWTEVKASGLSGDDTAPHPVTGELVTLSRLFKEVGREIKAGRKPPLADQIAAEVAADSAVINDDPPREPPTVTRGALPADEDLWATEPVTP